MSSGLIKRQLFDRVPQVRPTRPVGYQHSSQFTGLVTRPGTGETDARLSASRIWTTYANLLATVDIVAASVNWMFNLIAGAKLSLEPAETPDGDRLYEVMRPMLFQNPNVDMSEVVRYAATARMYGFAFQNFWFEQEEGGRWTIGGVQPRHQNTIRKFIPDPESGQLAGVEQAIYGRANSGSGAVLIPRENLIYSRFGPLATRFEGLGLLRQVVDASLKLKEYMAAHLIGSRNNFVGYLVARVPTDEIDEEIEKYAVGSAERAAAEAAAASLTASVDNWLMKANRTTNPGRIKLPSSIRGITDAGQNGATNTKMTNVYYWDLQILQGDATGLEHLLPMIVHYQKLIARVFGTESLLLGEGATGSFALSTDKNHQFLQSVDSIIDHVVEDVNRDLIRPLAAFNGFDPQAAPMLTHQSVNQPAISDIRESLTTLNSVGVLEPDDPIIDRYLTELGMDARTPERIEELMGRQEARRQEDLSARQNAPFPQGD